MVFVPFREMQRSSASEKPFRPRTSARTNVRILMSPSLTRVLRLEADSRLNARSTAWCSRCDRGEAAEDAVLLSVRTSREVDRVGGTAGASVADVKGPQPVDQDRLSLGVDDLAEELARVRIEGVDTTVPEIADQNVAGKLAEARRSLHHTPRRIEMVARGESREHVTSEIKRVHKSAAVSGNAVTLRRVRTRIGAEETPALYGNV